MRRPTAFPRSTLIRTVGPDVVILDWEMPLLSGAELVRIVRSPGVFPVPDVPIIMLSGHGERWRVVEAVKLGVNEYLVKPVSAKSIYDRLVSIIDAAAADGAARRLLRSRAAQAGWSTRGDDTPSLARRSSGRAVPPRTWRAHLFSRSGNALAFVRRAGCARRRGRGIDAHGRTDRRRCQARLCALDRPHAARRCCASRASPSASALSPSSTIFRSIFIDGRVLCAARPLGLRQDHAVAADRGLRAAERGPHPARRRSISRRCRRIGARST